ncbi:hypothetical protein TIFTF001_052859 [Ficus carica]|uniref:Uncharacterized protein n=1 Tax=Ficus carica TaxID=3494 RepID=A0AA88JD75_FICCA|nr:hypothetical protein TIFTF001_052859 [Ficus carica]
MERGRLVGPTRLPMHLQYFPLFHASLPPPIDSLAVTFELN